MSLLPLSLPQFPYPNLVIQVHLSKGPIVVHTLQIPVMINFVVIAAGSVLIWHIFSLGVGRGVRGVHTL